MKFWFLISNDTLQNYFRSIAQYNSCFYDIETRNLDRMHVFPTKKFGTGTILRHRLPESVYQSPADPYWHKRKAWWRHQMETFSALLAICAGNSPVSGEFSAQWPVTRSFDVFFDLCPNKRLSKQSWGWWFETPSGPLWRHSNRHRVIVSLLFQII